MQSAIQKMNNVNDKHILHRITSKIVIFDWTSTLGFNKHFYNEVSLLIKKKKISVVLEYSLIE